MTKNSVSELLTSVDSLFTTQEQRDEEKREMVKEIPLALIDDFPDHPFKVRMDASMDDLVKSITEYGVLVPVLVRQKTDGRYEMVAGHRRKMASQLAGKGNIHCIVRDLTDDEATLIMVDSNLQREEILPSEKAFAYKMKLEAIKKQGVRNDLTSAPLGPKLSSSEELAQKSVDSRVQIQRYIRLTNLIPALLDMVDKGKIAMRPAVELSYLTNTEQKHLADTISMTECTPSHAQAIRLRDLSKAGKLTDQAIEIIMNEEKPNQVQHIKLPREKISRYFAPGTSSQKIEDVILKALELYRKRQKNFER